MDIQILGYIVPECGCDLTKSPYLCNDCNISYCKHQTQSHSMHNTSFALWYIEENAISICTCAYEPQNLIFAYFNATQYDVSRIEHYSETQIPVVILNKLAYCIGGLWENTVLKKMTSFFFDMNMKLYSYNCTPMNIPRYKHSAIISESKIFVIGGYSKKQELLEPERRCEYYIQKYNIWKELPNLLYARIEPYCVNIMTVFNSRYRQTIAVFSGMNDLSEDNQTIELLNVVDMKWNECKIIDNFGINMWNIRNAACRGDQYDIYIFGGKINDSNNERIIKLEAQIAKIRSNNHTLTHFEVKYTLPSQKLQELFIINKTENEILALQPLEAIKLKTPHALYSYSNEIQNFIKMSISVPCRPKGIQNFDPAKTFCILWNKSLIIADKENNRKAMVKVLTESHKVFSLVQNENNFIITGGLKMDVGLSFVTQYTITKEFQIEKTELPNLIYARGAHSSVIINKAYLYVIGGVNCDKFIAPCEKFSFKDSKWRVCSYFPQSLNNIMCFAFQNRFIYAAGNESLTHIAEKFHLYLFDSLEEENGWCEIVNEIITQISFISISQISNVSFLAFTENMIKFTLSCIDNFHPKADYLNKMSTHFTKEETEKPWIIANWEKKRLFFLDHSLNFKNIDIQTINIK